MLLLLKAAGMALYFGVLTSIAPCPMTNNIVAISFIVRQGRSPRAALLSGVFYVLGATAVYVALAAVLVSGVLAAPGLSGVLQRGVARFLGPILILAGMVLLGLIRPTFGGSLISQETGQRVGRGGLWGAALLGALLALSFCPTSAGYFFCVLIPLAVEHNSRLLLPCFYGIGTAMPVIAFVFLIVFSLQTLGKAYNTLARIEPWLRRVTGAVFIAAGVYLSLIHIFGVSWLTGG